MSEYRSQVRKGTKEAFWTLGKVVPFLLVLVALFFGVSSLIKTLSVSVEREVFENSFQRTEALKSGLSRYEANLVEINYKLADRHLARGERKGLEAKRASLTMMINSTKGKM